jgi:hypothetical protein
LVKDARLDAPPARFIQWKAVMRPSSEVAKLSQVESVAINYLSKNVPPVVDDVSVQTSMRALPALNTGRSGNNSGNRGGAQANNDPNPAPHDRGAITVRWSAHDENDDTLTYSLYYKGDGESRWKLLRDKISDKSYSWDAGLLPDGGYTVRIVASDAPSHSPEDALSDFKDSSRFEIDNTPPRVEALNAKLEGGQLHIGELSDALIETYDINSPLPVANQNPTDDQKKNKRSRPKKSAGDNSPGVNGADDDYTNAPALSGEHVIVVRVYDRFDNAGIAKVIVK